MSLIAAAVRARAQTIIEEYHFGIECNTYDYTSLIICDFIKDCVVTDCQSCLKYNSVTSPDTTLDCSGVNISVSDIEVCTGVIRIEFLDGQNVTVFNPSITDPGQEEDGIITVVVTGSASVILDPATLLQAIVATSGSSASFKTGITPGGGEIIDDSIVAGTPLVYTLNYYYPSGITLYLTGNAIVKIYTRK